MNEPTPLAAQRLAALTTAYHTTAANPSTPWHSLWHVAMQAATAAHELREYYARIEENWMRRADSHADQGKDT